MEKVVKEVAFEEVEKWLDHKKISDKKRESYKEQVDLLVESISDGYLSLNDDFTFTQKLKFPISNQISTSQLTYKPRLKMSEIHRRLEGVKTSDSDGRVCAYIAALTSQPKEVIKELDTVDYEIGQAITIFFL
jgi:hypothetical protein